LVENRQIQQISKFAKFVVRKINAKKQKVKSKKKSPQTPYFFITILKKLEKKIKN
jgi:hypothetical protein